MDIETVTRRRVLRSAAGIAGAAFFGMASVALADEPLRVGAALPDPPFEFVRDGVATGFDVDFMQRVARALGRSWQLVPFEGKNFNAIFGGFAAGRYDCIASGTTVTPQREQVVDFCAPYALSGQSLVVDYRRHPNVKSIADLRGLVVGIQSGNTSEPVAMKLVAQGRAERVRVYPYNAIDRALDDLSTGGCDAFMKLAPVMHWMVKTRPSLRVVQTGITREALAVCVRRGNHSLKAAIERVQSQLRDDGTLGRLSDYWLG